MDLKSLLREQIERESSYLKDQEVGTDEYNSSMDRLSTLEDKLADLEQSESDAARKDKQMAEDRKDRLIKNSIEGAKTVGSFVLPIIGLVAITAFEKGDTFTTSLRGFVNCFIPKKL
jgi:hypothetical protein